MVVVDDEIQPLLNLYVHFEQFHPRSSNAIRLYCLGFCACSEILNKVHCASCLKLAGELQSSLVPRPFEGGRGREGLVSTACATGGVARILGKGCWTTCEKRTCKYLSHTHLLTSKVKVHIVKERILNVASKLAQGFRPKEEFLTVF